MAEFSIAFKKTMTAEGSYVHDPTDAGGETYRGVSRRYHPEWSGWPLIDAHKGADDLNAVLRSDEQLQAAVEQFYRTQYWNRFNGDAIPDQDIAVEMFDTAVNLGVSRAATYLQKALNYLNRNGKTYDDIVEDGKFGPASVSTLEKYLTKDPAGYVLTIMNILQGMHYLEYMSKNPTQEKYARGWLKRVELGKQGS